MSRIRGPQESKCLRSASGTENVRNGASPLAAGATLRGCTTAFGAGRTTAFGAGLGALDTGLGALGTGAFGAGLGNAAFEGGLRDGLRLTAAFGAGLIRDATDEELALGSAQRASGRNTPEGNSGMTSAI